MNATKRRKISRRRSPKLVSTAAALGGAVSLAGAPASGLELSDVRVESSLGQPLRASIGFKLNPNEQMFDFCVRLRQGPTDNAIPLVTRARISVAGNRIVIVGDAAVKDPLLDMQVIVDCPYTPQLARQYTLIVDPVEFVQNEIVLVDEPTTATTVPVVASIPVSEASTDNVPAVVTSSARAPIAMNSEYRVQNGDSASVIAVRIENRTNSLQSAIELLVANNPDAFVDGDASRLKAGSLLTIPTMNEEFAPAATMSEPVVADVREYAPESALAAPQPGAPMTPAAAIENPVADAPENTPPAEVSLPAVAAVPAAQSSSVTEPVPNTVATAPVVESADESVAEDVAARSTATPATDELQPGDVVIAPADQLPARNTPVVTTADSATGSTGNAWTWLSWPIGGALLLIGGLALAGRQLWQKFGSIAIGDPDQPAAAAETQLTVDEIVAETAQHETVEAPLPEIDDVDFAFDDTSSDASISLDADLDAGTGLRDSGEIDVAQDFAFATSGQVEQSVDHEFPADAAEEPEESGTDIIPPSHKEITPSILESEVAPEDDYDMSMIVDATKQNIGDTHLTAQDLQAVPLDLDSSGTYSITDDTLASDTDLAVLEQDYQDEFTQTQALNKEIEQAAMELAAKLDDDINDEINDDIDDDDPTGDEPILTIEDPGLDPTAEMPARHPEDELTAEMPARTIDNDATADAPAQTSATEVTAELAANVAAENDDVADVVADVVVDEEITSRLAAAGNEPTAEMPIDTVIADPDDDR